LDTTWAKKLNHKNQSQKSAMPGLGRVSVHLSGRPWRLRHRRGSLVWECPRFSSPNCRRCAHHLPELCGYAWNAAGARVSEKQKIVKKPHFVFLRNIHLFQPSAILGA
jgi:hypothetical protein